MKKKLKQKKDMKLVIERIIYDSKTERLQAVDLYDEANGRAYYCEVVDSH